MTESNQRLDDSTLTYAIVIIGFFAVVVISIACIVGACMLRKTEKSTTIQYIKKKDQYGLSDTTDRSASRN